MATSSPILALPLPTSTDADQVPADLLTLMTAAEKFFGGRFASSAARSALIPSPVRGMVSWVDADGYATYYDGTIWRPFSGQRVAPVYSATMVAALNTGVGSTGGWTTILSLPSVPFPTRVRIEYQTYVTFATPGDQSDAAVYVNGSTYKRSRIQTGGTTVGGAFSLDIATSTATTLQGILIKALGSGNANTITDTSLCWLLATVEAQ